MLDRRLGYKKFKEATVAAGLQIARTVNRAVIPAALPVAATAGLSIVPAFSDDIEVITKAENATSNLRSSIYKLAMKLIPFSLLVLFVAIIFTHDQKALATELKIGAGIMIVGILIFIFCRDDTTAETTITQIVGE